MRISLGTVLTVVGALAVPAAAHAQAHHPATSQQHPAQHPAPSQHEMKHELGIDLNFSYYSVSGGNSGINIKTPVDLRFGFVSQKKLTPEIRFAMNLLSGGGTVYNIDPGLNVLYMLNRQSIQRNTYLTGGADAQIIDAGANSGVVPGVNVGIGMRRPYESGAWRLEGYFKYMFKNTSLGFGNTTQFGVRAGLSLWH